MASTGSIIARDDTLLGVCFALGEDFGFNPLYLRIVLAMVVLWSLPTAIAVYAGLGLPVALSRWLAPNPQPEQIAEPEATDCEGEMSDRFRLAA